MSIIKLNNQGVKNATAFGSITGLGSMTFIKKLTASSSSTLSFVDGASSVVLDNTYKEYVFTFNNIHPSADTNKFLFNGSDDTSSHSYDITKTTTDFTAYNAENDSDRDLYYRTGDDLAQSTSAQQLSSSLGSDNDQSCSGYLHLFNPSSTTFVKHFMSNVSTVVASDISTNQFTAGYFNTTAAITAIQFSMNSGNIDAGDTCLYGIA